MSADAKPPEPGPPKPSDSRSTIVEPGVSWWLDPALAKLAFGSRPRRRTGGAATGVASHLAFLPPENLEIDLDDPEQRTFGDYELLELIGQGGMGVVYRARQHSLDRDVAVKLLSAGPWASVDFIARFQREAQSAARMQHPNIVPIHEIGAHEELNFFSMRLVNGGSLASLLAKRGALPPREAARILRAVAEAVDYAHRLDVLHLDLKPGNVLLDDDSGEPLVADFGLAKRLDESLAADSSEVSGTPSYMAPEQAQVDAQSLTPATDIYGLGAILYECLVGRPPFAAASAQETLRQVVSEAAPSLRSADARIPADLEAICLKCLAKDPAARYRSARALADDLNRFLEGREVRARPLHGGQRLLLYARRQPWLTAAVALLFFSLLGGFAASWVQWKRAENNARSAQSLLWEGRREAALQLGREGRGFEALPRLLENLREQRRAGRVDEAAMEQRRIELLVAQGPRLIDRTVIADANPLATAVSPGGTLVALALNDQTIRWYDAATLTERGRVDLGGRPSSDGQPRPVLLLRFIDEHRLIATMEWYANQVSPQETDSWLVDLDAGRVLQPPPAFADFADAGFSANGRYALLRNHAHQSQLWQVSPWRPVSALTPTQPDYLPWTIDPQGRFVAMLSIAMQQLHVFRVPGLERRTIELPGRAGVSAWALGQDGNVMALGDFEGRVFLLDTATLAVRALPIERGSQVTWLSFSEDGAWLATASHDGAVRAFDVATGDSLASGQMAHDFVVQRVGISREQRLLVVAGEGQSALWRLPLPGPRTVPAQRIALAPAPHGLTGRYPFGWSLDTGLIASAGIDGQLRLWRLPAAPTLPATAAAQIPERTHYHGGRVVDVAWNRLRIASPAGGSLSPWLELPHPPGFAELLDEGRLLVLTHGSELRFYDAVSMKPRHRPIALPASPERLLANADGSRILLCFGENGVAGFMERLMVFDGQTGRRMPGEAALPGPLRHLALSADDRRVLALGPADGASFVLATDGLRQLGEFPHDPYEPVLWGDFTPSGDEVLLVTRATDSRLGSDALVTWHPVKDVATTRELPPQTRPLGVVAAGSKVFVSGQERDVLLAPAPAEPQSPARFARSSAIAETALSGDGRVLARAFRREVELLDVASGRALGPPLQADGNAMDLVAQLAFSKDGASLLARTVQGHWLLWPIAAPTPAAHLAAALPSLRVDTENQHLARLPAEAERRQLRGDDPGGWPAPAPRWSPTLVAAADGTLLPARRGGLDADVVDLGAAYNFAPDEVRNSFYNIRPTMRPLPAGLHRIGGWPFEIRGMVQVGVAEYGRPPGTRTSVRCLATPAAKFAALRPLMAISARAPIATGQAVGFYTLHFDDGSQARIPVRAGHEVRGYAGEDEGVPVVFAGDRALTLLGLRDDALVAPRLANPHPERSVRCLDIETPDNAIPMLVLALTIERGAGM